MNVEKARAAMNVGVQAARRQQLLNQQYYANVQAQRRRAEIARRNQQIYAARQRQQNYWAQLGVSVKSTVMLKFVFFNIQENLLRHANVSPRKAERFGYYNRPIVRSTTELFISNSNPMAIDFIL